MATTALEDMKTENQMKQLHEEVNEMKKLMAALKQGSAIGEMFKQPQPSEVTQSIKSQNLEALKKQRQFHEIQTKKGLETNPTPGSEESPFIRNNKEQLDLSKLSQLHTIQKSIEHIQKLKQAESSKLPNEIDPSTLSELN